MKQPHICLEPMEGVTRAILPGDPARVDRIAALLDGPKELAYNREFRSILGTFHGKKILALSTGIGGCSAGIAAEELNRIGVRTVIRVGSCGALQPEIALGELILACGAVRDDGTSKTYVPEIFPAVPDFSLLTACVRAAERLGCRHRVGIVHSHESFYHDGTDQVSAYWSERGILGADMETAALLTIARLRGMKAASILNNVVLSGEDTAESVGDYVSGESLTAEGEKNEILVALEALAAMPD